MHTIALAFGRTVLANEALAIVDALESNAMNAMKATKLANAQNSQHTGAHCLKGEEWDGNDAFEIVAESRPIAHIGPVCVGVLIDPFQRLLAIDLSVAWEGFLVLLHRDRLGG